MDAWSVLVVLLLAVAILYAVRILRRITVYEYQIAVAFRRGRLARVLPAGPHWYVRAWSQIMLLDSRPRLVTVPGQEILTRDSVSVKLSLMTKFQLKDAKAAVLNAENFEQALYAALQDTLRTFVGSLPVEELVARRSEIAEAVQRGTTEPAANLGLEIHSVSVKDIMFPGSLRDAFAQVTKARQDGLAALERARGESAAVRNLANTARVVENNPYLFQLRLLQSIAESKAGTLVVNVPPAPEARRRRDAEAEPSGNDG